MGVEVFGGESIVKDTSGVRRWRLIYRDDGDIDLVRCNSSGVDQETVLNIDGTTGTITAADLAVSAVLSALSISGDLTFTGAASRIILGLTASAGNAQVEFRKGGANNQSWGDWQSDSTSVWLGQHDSSENWSILDSSAAVVFSIQRGTGATDRYVRASNGLRLGSATGPLELQGTSTPEAAVTAPVGSTFRQTDGTQGNVFWVKESGAGNTGWVSRTAVALAPAADGAVAILSTTTRIVVSTASGATTAISTTSSYDGQRISLQMTADAGGGSYTLAVTGGTLTLNAANETALVERIGSAWVVLSLNGATIV